MTDATYAIGIDLGGSSVKAVSATPAGETLSRHNLDFDSNKRMAWAEKISALVRQISNERGAMRLASSASPNSERKPHTSR